MGDTSTCGACAGTAMEVPAAKLNRSGQSAIHYRVGTHREFKAALLSRLSTVDFPALNPLTTRDDDDFTVAACDAFSVLADVLTFYQERIANESYLRTAVERRSVLHLGNLIGYRLAPGVAASTALAFALESAPGVPALAAQPVTIPVGTRVQSVPDPGQDPQTFETTVAITGRVEWNAIPVQVSEPLLIARGLGELYVGGTNTQLQPGDMIGLISRERELAPASARWCVRALDTVETDSARNLTRITWSTPLGGEWASPDSARGVRIYAFRQRAALFGHNAPDPRLLKVDSSALVEHGQWLHFAIPAGQKYIDLDAPYPKIAAESWVALTGGETPAVGETPAGVDYQELCRVDASAQISRTDFGLSGRLTRLTLEQPQHLENFPLRSTQVLAQSEELSRVERPLTYPLYGRVLALGRLQGDLAPLQPIAISGKRQRVVMSIATAGVTFLGETRKVTSGESFIMRRPPEQFVKGALTPITVEMLDPGATLSGKIRWHLQTDDGAAVTVDAPFGSLVLAPALKGDTIVSEIATIAKGAIGVQSDLVRTTLTLTLPLQYCYDRSTVSINANVANATHGEAVSEIAGSGDSSKTNQRFRLKQSPLTHVSTMSEPSGRSSTLEARVNDVLWKPVETLSGRGALEHVYALRQDEEGNSTIQFGDGVNGARLPRGDNNVRLRYRKGIGIAGNLRAGQLSMLLTRPLGVKSALNPIASSGGQDPELLSDARKNAPLPVLTLGRAVSIRDYVDYARTFPGVAKADGLWISDGRRRGIYLTVAGPGGGEVSSASDTFVSLFGALRRYGDALLPLLVKSYVAATFKLRAKVKVAADSSADIVMASVATALRAAYSFERREFGQPVAVDEVYATIQNVPGVVAVDVDLLRRSDATAGDPVTSRIFARPTVVGEDGIVSAAELLTLDPQALELGAMQ